MDVRNNWTFRTHKMADEPKMHITQPRLVALEDLTSQAEPVWSPKSAAKLLQVVETELTAVARSTAESAAPISSPQGPAAEAAPEKSRNYLQALELLSGAARTMA